jgi:hypothetical protein
LSLEQLLERARKYRKMADTAGPASVKTALIRLAQRMEALAKARTEPSK